MALREFEPSLSETVHAIRNHPSVRERLRDPNPIPLESHRRWVRENLIDERRLRLFVVFRRDEAQGIALLRNFQDAEAEVGVMMVHAERRRLTAYVAAHLVAYVGFELLGLERLLSNVPLGNEAALAFNLACGFAPIAPPSGAYHRLALAREQSRSHPVHGKFRRTRKIIAST